MARILVVDDHGAMRRAVCRLLTEAFPDATFGEADSLDAGLQCLASERWDVTIVDLRLQDGSGLTIVEEVRRRWPATQTIVLSGLAREMFEARALAVGARAFISKPDLLDHLVDAVTEALGER